MGIINKLDPHIANLIAAGEVVERASSVVKELVENSIDAKATTITISLIESGLKEINVKDNGIGMDFADARMSFEPHATSKIKTTDDLYNINTLGFRGEALPSIVAVSNFTLKTSTEGGKGIMYSLKGGNLVSEAMVSCPKGTEISVRNLFFNTPARLQNLQSTQVELGYIIDYVQKESLAHPSIAFKLLNNEKIVFQTYGSNSLLEVISMIYTNEVTKEMRDIFNNNGFFKINGYISKISVTRSNRNHIHIICNGRPIKSFNIIKAVLDGYEQYLMIGRFPICVINITVDPSLVDVNVHPSKLEVRFSNEDELVLLIKDTIADALKGTNMIINMDQSNNDSKVNNLSVNTLEDNNKQTTEEDYDDNDSSIDDDTNELLEEDEVSSEEDSFCFDDFKIDNGDKPILINENNVSNSDTKDTTSKEKYSQQQYTFDDEKLYNDKLSFSDKLPKLTYLSQLFGTYLLCQDDDYFYVIDQHAANERINYEKISRELNKNSVISYELLVPIKVEFSLSESLLINEVMDKINALGIILDDFGGGTFTVREVPVWLFKGREKEFVEEIITKIISNTKSDKGQFLDSLAKSLACKKSIKANQFISQLEAEYMLEDLKKCERPYTCPHGRPVIIKFTKYEIEKWFKRVQ